MNRMLRLLPFLLLVSSFAFSQSLGDIARQNRLVKRKPATHVYTDDDIASHAPVSPQTSSKPNEDPNAADKESKDGSSATNTSEAQKADKDSEDAVQKRWEQYKSRVADQKSKVDLLQRELEVAKRQNEIQVAEYYADAGARLRNPEYFSKQMAKYQDTIDAKTKAIQEANTALENLREEGRKAGVPASYLE